ncbi:MAG: hypothetical protein U0531_16915 [Dehalococcoidia bacterium]
MAATPRATNSCGGTFAPAAGNTSLSLSGGAIGAAGGSCAVSVSVTGTTAGAKVNTTGAVTSTEGGAGLDGVGHPERVRSAGCRQSFSPATIAVGGVSTLTLSFTNPAANPGGLTGIALSDTFPAGVQVDTAPGATNSCGGTFAPAAGATTVSLSGGAIAAAGGTCAVSVKVKATTSGAKVNSTGAVSSTEGGTGGTATATLSVLPPDLVVTKGCSPAAPATLASGGVVSCTLVVSNAAATAPASIAAGTALVQDAVTLPAGVTGQVVAVAAAAGYSCPLVPSTPGPVTLTVTCTATAADTLASGQVRAFTVSVRLTNTGATAQSVSDVATVDPAAAIPETNEDNNTSGTVTTAVAVGTPSTPPPATTADLALTKVALVDPVTLGVSPVVFAVTVTNLGPAAAAGWWCRTRCRRRRRRRTCRGHSWTRRGRRAVAAGRRRLRRR